MYRAIPHHIAPACGLPGVLALGLGLRMARRMKKGTLTYHASVPNPMKCSSHSLRWHYPDQVPSVGGRLCHPLSLVPQAPVAVGHYSIVCGSVYTCTTFCSIASRLAPLHRTRILIIHRSCGYMCRNVETLFEMKRRDNGARRMDASRRASACGSSPQFRSYARGQRARAPHGEPWRFKLRRVSPLDSGFMVSFTGFGMPGQNRPSRTCRLLSGNDVEN